MLEGRDVKPDLNMIQCSHVSKHHTALSLCSISLFLYVSLHVYVCASTMLLWSLWLYNTLWHLCLCSFCLEFLWKSKVLCCLLNFKIALSSSVTISLVFDENAVEYGDYFGWYGRFHDIHSAQSRNMDTLSKILYRLHFFLGDLKFP